MRYTNAHKRENMLTTRKSQKDVVLIGLNTFVTEPSIDDQKG